ncbi:hypothetical protein [Cellvibrio japonicus]|uniref:hypothetical protein n=1 Tax=Cellvibrio japonicus TaxID=155077 RepID=UPI0005A0013D|nr:hypothetical protein [Cellvibrio japonicus]QEI13806.1 hypothetical protein FY117_17370 [Cellvibrio japonicus]QEI17380.1 hypothetical protein FY116_17375 [Cellvibrio japonicus]QEI20956.1 hypothetical protein FY115_17370 [Cellvibrio japonicus]
MEAYQFRFLSEEELLIVSGGLTAAEEAEREALRRQQEQNRPVEEVTVTGYRIPSDGNHISYADYANMMHGRANASMTIGNGKGGVTIGGDKGVYIPPMSSYMSYMQGQKTSDSGCQTCHY